MRRLARWSALALALAAVLTVSASESAEPELPASLIGDFVVKIATYDKNLVARARPRARVVVLQRRDDVVSARVALGVAARLRQQETIAGLPMEVEVLTAGTAAELATSCRADHIAVVVLSSGFEDRLLEIASALDHVDVLTFGVLGSYAQHGAVVALDVREGKPRIIVNLARARSQNVALSADLLKLAQVLP